MGHTNIYHPELLIQNTAQNKMEFSLGFIAYIPTCLGKSYWNIFYPSSGEVYSWVYYFLVCNTNIYMYNNVCIVIWQKHQNLIFNFLYHIKKYQSLVYQIKNGMGPVGDPLKGNTPAPLALLPYAHPAPRCCFKHNNHIEYKRRLS